MLALEVDDKSAVETVHPVFVSGQQLDSSGASKPRFIITARALEDPSEAEIETDTEHETTEYASTDETEETMTEEKTPSTENGLFTSTSAATYTTELAATDPSDDAEQHESVVARTGEVADDASSVS